MAFNLKGATGDVNITQDGEKGTPSRRTLISFENISPSRIIARASGPNGVEIEILGEDELTEFLYAVGRFYYLSTEGRIEP